MQPSDLLDNKYRIEQKLGEGGMGAVYRAVHIGTKRTVAVKIIHPRLSNYEEFVERFRREAEAAGRLRHPNVVDVTDFGFAQTSEGLVAYLVMEYLDGCTLAQILEEEMRLPIRWVVDVLEQVCSAVDEAHRLGIIHRDLKPDNIWLEPNRRGDYTVKVLDFGLVKLSEVEQRSTIAESKPAKQTQVDDASSTRLFSRQEDKTLLKPPVPITDSITNRETGDKKSDSNGRMRGDVNVVGDASLHKTRDATELTRLGSVMGTPLYMSPEQCRGGPLDTRSDIYTLGVIAYRMLAGEPPFAGDQHTLIDLHLSGAATPLKRKNRRVPRKMARLVMSALSKDPAARPQTAAGFGSALGAAMESTGQLLRHAIALYSEHFPTFFKVALIGYTPLILVLAFSFVIDKVGFLKNLEPVSQGKWGVGIFGAIVLSNLLAYFIVSAATVPVVVQLMIAPLRALKLSAILSVIKRRWTTLLTTSLLVVALIVIGTVLFVIPGAIAAVCFALYAPVVIIENLGVWSTLNRAGSLAKRSLLSVITITLLQFALPILVWRASITSTFTLKLNDDYSPKEFGFSFVSSSESALFQLLNIFVAPLTGIMLSLVYLKTRQSGGESLSDASERFEALDMPRSKWQMLMRHSSSRTR